MKHRVMDEEGLPCEERWQRPATLSQNHGGAMALRAPPAACSPSQVVTYFSPNANGAEHLWQPCSATNALKALHRRNFSFWAHWEAIDEPPISLACVLTTLLMLLSAELLNLKLEVAQNSGTSRGTNHSIVW